MNVKQLKRLIESCVDGVDEHAQGRTPRERADCFVAMLVGALSVEDKVLAAKVKTVYGDPAKKTI